MVAFLLIAYAFTFTFPLQDTKMLYSALKMNCLKHLVVKCSNDKGKSLLPLTKLIDASPCLERFVLVVKNSFSEI